MIINDESFIFLLNDKNLINQYIKKKLMIKCFYSRYNSYYRTIINVTFGHKILIFRFFNMILYNF